MSKGAFGCHFKFVLICADTTDVAEVCTFIVSFWLPYSMSCFDHCLGYLSKIVILNGFVRKTVLDTFMACIYAKGWFNLRSLGFA